MPDPTVAPQSDVETPEDFLPINGTDYVEFYVGNAKQAAQFYAHLFGFDIQGYLGPETGHKEKASYLLEQNDIRFVLTSALGPDSPISEHVHRHGNGVKDIALWVDDAASSFEGTTMRPSSSSWTVGSCTGVAPRFVVPSNEEAASSTHSAMSFTPLP